MLTVEILNKIILSIDVHDTPKAAGLPETEEVQRVWDETKAEMKQMKERDVAPYPVSE